MIVDLHCHSTASDGSLSPQALIDRASERGVRLFSITDHDTVGAYAGLDIPAAMRLIPGVELSCVWSGVTIHVVGLDVDLAADSLRNALQRQAQAREERGRIIGERLARCGIDGAFDGALVLAEGRAVGRPDFARFMVDRGHVANMNEAFDRYLGSGKIGDVKALWPGLAEVVEWIRLAGGVAVIAHPLKYRMTAMKLRALLGDFAAAGGQAMEVSSAKQSADELRHTRRLCRRFGLEASVGSDFHAQAPWSELGCDAHLVGDCPPVWRRWLDGDGRQTSDV